METKLAGERHQAASGQQVPYKLTINRDGAMATWDGDIALAVGFSHRLRGGVVFEVDATTVEAAVTKAFERELETLNLDELNRRYGQ